jgi:hypothetical protein
MSKERMKYLLANLQLFAEGEDYKPPVVDQNQDYIEAIKKLKEDSVPKEEYEKVVAERKKLLANLINGEPADGDGSEGAADADASPDLSELRKKIMTADGTMTNLDYVTNVLKLRDAIIKEQGEDADPFLPPYSSNATARTSIDIERDRENANCVAEFLQGIVSDANGDPTRFNGLLTAGLVDDPQIAMQVKAKKAVRKGK